jgi:hypothetical protein
MDALMGTSPVVSKAALVHSASHIDLSVLSRDGGGDDEGSENGSSDNSDEAHLPMHYPYPVPEKESDDTASCSASMIRLKGRALCKASVICCLSVVEGIEKADNLQR